MVQQYPPDDHAVDPASVNDEGPDSFGEKPHKTGETINILFHFLVDNERQWILGHATAKHQGDQRNASTFPQETDKHNQQS